MPTRFDFPRSGYQYASIIIICSNNDIIKTAYSNSDTSSVQSIYPSVEDLSDIYPSTSHHIGPLIGTSSIPVTIAEEIIPNIKVQNYSTYPKPPLSDSSSSPQTDLDKAFIFNSPTKTRPVTMQSKLDPTKINTSLYQKVINIKLFRSWLRFYQFLF